MFSSVIGTGVFTGNAKALELAGPGGFLFAVAILGLLACCVGETISELVQLFPTPNAVFEYVKAFVDEEWAWVVTIQYFYVNASVFATLMLGAASLMKYWDPGDVLPPVLFYVVAPVALFFINFTGIKVKDTRVTDNYSVHAANINNIDLWVGRSSWWCIENSTAPDHHLYALGYGPNSRPWDGKSSVTLCTPYFTGTSLQTDSMTAIRDGFKHDVRFTSNTPLAIWYSVTPFLIVSQYRVAN